MSKQLTPAQVRRRRRAAFELRCRVATCSTTLPASTAMRLLLPDLKRIAEAAGCDPEKLTDAALRLYPGTHNDYTTEQEDQS